MEDIKQKVNELLEASNKIKQDLDATPFKEQKQFVLLINKMLKAHRDLEETNAI
ncbi:hypothetical protein [Peribacillus sp. SCS-37]|uniref:hypothetical protein n=1 Tax=Paraperibacillus esterisolvens TaxID=3115296 RepID=UPI003905AE79